MSRYYRSHEFTDRSEIEIEILRFESEAAADVANGPFERHQRRADGVGLAPRQRLLIHPPNRLALHQLAQELHQRQHQPGDRFLHVLRFGIPSRRSRAAPRGAWRLARRTDARPLEPPFELT